MSELLLLTRILELSRSHAWSSTPPLGEPGASRLWTANVCLGVPRSSMKCMRSNRDPVRRFCLAAGRRSSGRIDWSARLAIDLAQRTSNSGGQVDSVAALIMVARMHTESPLVAVVARERALTFSESCVRPQVVKHTPGDANKLADLLSQRFQLGVPVAVSLAPVGVPEVHNRPRTVDSFVACDPRCKQGVRDLSRSRVSEESSIIVAWR